MRRAPAETLILFARPPLAGRVKTRLGREIGFVPAALLYRSWLAASLRQLGRLGRWRIEIHWAARPDHREPLAKGRPCRLQKEGDLGARMAAAIGRAQGERVLIIGSDVPSIRPRHIARAFALLKRHRAVLGPSEDGGYWLVGFSGPRSRRARLAAVAFADVRWSTPDALADTLRGLGAVTYALADPLSDIDDLEDLRRARAAGAN